MNVGKMTQSTWICSHSSSSSVLLPMFLCECFWRNNYCVWLKRRKAASSVSNLPKKNNCLVLSNKTTSKLFLPPSSLYFLLCFCCPPRNPPTGDSHTAKHILFPLQLFNNLAYCIIVSLAWYDSDSCKWRRAVICFMRAVKWRCCGPNGSCVWVILR